MGVLLEVYHSFVVEDFNRGGKELEKLLIGRLEDIGRDDGSHAVNLTIFSVDPISVGGGARGIVTEGCPIRHL